MIKLIVNPDTCNCICLSKDGNCPNMDNPDSPCFISLEDRDNQEEQE